MSESQDEHSHHIVPMKYYLGVYIALLVLTVITVAVAQFDFGRMNIVIAMAVAVVKASCVACIFMGLLWDRGFNRIIILGTFVFLGIFIGFTAADVFTRKATDPVEAQYHSLKSPVKPLSEAGHGTTHSEQEHH